MADLTHPAAAVAHASFAAAPSPAPAVVLGAPLPAEITGRTQGWLTGYRRYPVFSPAWVRLRARSVALLVLAVVLLPLAGLTLVTEGTRPWGALLQATLGVVLPLFAGPWLGSLVRRRHWPARQELLALTSVVLALVAGVAAFKQWGAESMKQTLAEWTGDVDEHGLRKRVTLSIGVTVRRPDQAVEDSMGAMAGAAASTATGASGAQSTSESTSGSASASSAGPRPISILVSAERLAQAVARLQERLASRSAAPELGALVDQLAARLRGADAAAGSQAPRLRWVSASVGDTIKLFGIDEVRFFQSDEKNTRVVTAGDEAHVRKPLKEIADGLDPEVFWQVHRGTLVRASEIARATRDELGRITLHLKHHGDKLSVSQAWAWRFKPM